MATTPDRRTFLKGAAAASASLALGPSILSGCATPRRYASGKLRHAGIGVGGMGEHDLKEIAGHPDVEIVALCDVDRGKLDNAAAKHPDARTYVDWRTMLANEAEHLDSVHVSVPDHMHAPAMMSAMALGLHVYGQKPLTHNVLEARRLAEAAEAFRLVTQMGIQNRSNFPFRKAHTLFEDGIIGPIREAHVWTDRPAGWWPQGVGRPEGTDPVPATLNWDSWLGVAPWRDYKEGEYHAFRWRGRKDFGTGAQGDMACHLMDPVPWFLGLDRPKTVRSSGPKPNDESFPEWSVVSYGFDAGNAHCDGDGVAVTWYDGKRMPDDRLAEFKAGDDVYANACLFVADDAAFLVSPYDDCRLLTRDGEVELTLPELEPINHWHQWVDGCLGRGETSAPFSYAGPLTEIALLGNVALEFSEETLTWDGPAMRFPDRPQADKLLRETYRRGWEIPGLA